MTYQYDIGDSIQGSNFTLTVTKRWYEFDRKYYAFNMTYDSPMYTKVTRIAFEENEINDNINKHEWLVRRKPPLLSEELFTI